MKKLLSTFAMLTLVSTLALAGGGKIQLLVTGMHCDGCAKTVNSSIEKIDGVSHSTVDFSSLTASIAFDDEKTSTEDIIAAIKEAGYTAEIANEENMQKAKEAMSSRSGKAKTKAACCAGKSKSSCGAMKSKAKSEL